MARVDEHSEEIVGVAQSYVKHGDRSNLVQFNLASLVKADLQLGSKDLQAGYRVAIKKRILELTEAEMSATKAAKRSPVEKAKNGLINHPVTGPGIMLAVIIMAIASFAGSMDSLVGVYKKYFSTPIVKTVPSTVASVKSVMPVAI
ncbi:MAG: hypothetical protein ACKE51_05745 [Methylococcaceae bacterium]